MKDITRNKENNNSYTYKRKINNTSITTKPDCLYNKILMDSVSIGHVIFSFDADTDEQRGIYKR